MVVKKNSVLKLSRIQSTQYLNFKNPTYRVKKIFEQRRQLDVTGYQKQESLRLIGYL